MLFFPLLKLSNHLSGISFFLVVYEPLYSFIHSSKLLVILGQRTFIHILPPKGNVASPILLKAYLGNVGGNPAPRGNPKPTQAGITCKLHTEKTLMPQPRKDPDASAGNRPEPFLQEHYPLIQFAAHFKTAVHLHYYH